jgi:glycosyltransferase involved in cell wall biosynthesis
MNNDLLHQHAISEPLITAIIPTYRRPRMLKRAIHSVLNQTYPNLQVCVYDNASGDETEAVVREIAEKDPRVKYFCHPTNIGAARNFEHGLSHVNTPYFSLLSDDDVLLPDFYTKSLQAFEKHPDAGFTIGVSLQMDEGGKVLAAPVLQLPAGYYPAPHGVLPLLHPWVPLWTGLLFRREVIGKTGGFDLSIPAFDHDFELQAAANFPYVVFHDPVAIYLVHSASTSVFLPYDMVWPGWQQIAMKLKEDQNLPRELREQLGNVLHRKTKQILFAVGLEDVARGLYDDAQSVASILREELTMQSHSRLLKAAIWLSKRLKPAHGLISFLYSMRKRIRRRQLRKLQPMFGHYSRYLWVPGDPAG